MDRIFPIDYVQNVLNVGGIEEHTKQSLLKDELVFSEKYEDDIMWNLLTGIKELKQIDDKTCSVVLRTKLGKMCELYQRLDELYEECRLRSTNRESMTQELADRILNVVNSELIDYQERHVFESIFFSETEYEYFSRSIRVGGAISSMTMWDKLMDSISACKSSLIADIMKYLNVRLWELERALVLAGLENNVEMIEKLKQQGILLIQGKKYISSQSEKEDLNPTIKY